MFFRKTYTGEIVFDNGWKLAGWYLVMNAVGSLVSTVIKALLNKRLEYGDQN